MAINIGRREFIVTLSGATGQPVRARQHEIAQVATAESKTSGTTMRLAASFVPRRRLTRLPPTASKRWLAHLMTRRFCKPKPGPPKQSSMRPAAIIAAQSRP
jgi:hypothetical protein